MDKIFHWKEIGSICSAEFSNLHIKKTKQVFEIPGATFTDATTYNKFGNKISFKEFRNRRENAKVVNVSMYMHSGMVENGTPRVKIKTKIKERGNTPPLQ
jgi:hypothetical protein